MARTDRRFAGALLLALSSAACGEDTAEPADVASTGDAESTGHVVGTETTDDGVSTASTSDAEESTSDAEDSSDGGSYPPGPAGCGLESAAFCDTFDAPAGASTRAGELDPNKWSAARMCNIGGPTNNDEAVAIGLATIGTCRSDLPDRVPVELATLVCDGNDQIHSNHLLVAAAAQNYGQHSLRARQPFDFAGRTGSIVFDAEGYNVGLLGWISVEVTELPTPAPSFTLQENYENGSIPENGIEIQLAHICGGENVGVSDILVYDDFAQLSVFTAGQTCVPAAQGRLNHFEVRLSEQRVEVLATPASADGVTFEAPILIASADIALPFSRGYVHFTTHNHATLKYSEGAMDAWVARWDNLAFDGPAITGAFREYEALDSLTQTASGMTNVAYRLADASQGPAQTIEIHGVDPQGATRAQLALQNWSLRVGSEPPADFALNYRVNDGPWQARMLTASELQMMADLPNAGTRSLMLDVDVAALVDGTNRLQFTTSNADVGYPPVVLNIDLILETP
jgi:hypothetical protein